jgi:hypothetical protein
MMIGGGGEKKTLRLVARYADACNVFGGPDVATKFDILRAHCEAEGRGYDAIEKTVCVVRPPLADVDGFLEEVEGYAKLGVSEVMLMPDRHPVEFVSQLAERAVPRALAIG